MKHYLLSVLSTLVLFTVACTKDGPTNHEGAEYDGWWYLESVTDVVQLEPVSDNLWICYEKEYTVSSTCLWVYISRYQVTKYGNESYLPNLLFSPRELPHIYEGPASVEAVAPWGGDDDGYSKGWMYWCMVHPGYFSDQPDDSYMDVRSENGRLFFSCSDDSYGPYSGDINGDGLIEPKTDWTFKSRGSIWYRIEDDCFICFENNHLPHAYEWANTWVRSDESHFQTWAKCNKVWFEKY